MYIARLWKFDGTEWQSTFERCETKEEAIQAGERFVRLMSGYDPHEKREFEVYEEEEANHE